MRVFRVADLEPERFEAYLRETLRRSPGRVAHVFNQGLYQWPPDERPETYGAKILAFLARAADWRDGDAERRRRVALASGQEKRAKFPTSKAPISAVFHSFRLIFGRAIISWNGLEAWMLFLERAGAEHSR